MQRRTLILGLTAGAAALAAGGMAATLRLHRDPRRTPFLTDAHLQGVSDSLPPGPRVLFAGNSMLLRFDVPKLVSEIAASEGHTLSSVMAAADGARLVETWRIGAFRTLLTAGTWDAVVLQDFTKTPLRAVDRWGASHAIRQMAEAVRPAPVLLYPPNPAAAGNGVYRDAGFLTEVPDGPADFADRAMAHYTRVADANGLTVVPVPTKWVEADNADFYVEDLHHPSEAGARFIAGLLWPAIREAIGL